MPTLTYKLDLSASAVDSLISNGVVRVGTASVPTAVNTAIFSADTSSGSDVWFSSDAAGATPIAAKLIYWSDADSVFAFDVAAGSLSATTGATIYLHVGDKPGSYDTDPYPATVEVVMSDEDFTNLTNNTNDGTGGGGVAAGGVTGPDGHGPATDFDGTDDRVDFTVSGVAEPVTMSAWFNLDDSDRAVIVGLADEDTTNDQLRADYDVNEVVAQVFDGALFGATKPLAGGDPGNWHHIAAVFTSASSRVVYLDGVAGSPDTTVSTAANFDRLSVGVSADSTPVSFADGQIANVRFDSAVRTAAEINLEYLLQGSNAATYWTVTGVASGTLQRVRYGVGLKLGLGL